MANKFSWTSDEDQTLMSLVHEQGDKKWSFIAELLNNQFPDSGKTGKQCRERWHNHLDPVLDKTSFTIADEVKIFELQKQYGNKWSLIADHFEGRNDSFIKNCFYSAIRRNLRKYNRNKIPSKQLKGTISSLLKNSGTRKILLDFPEHRNLTFSDKPPKKKPERPSSLKLVPKVIASQGFPKIDLEDLTPFYNNLNLGITEDIEQDFHYFLNSPIERNSTDCIRIEPLSANQITIPEYYLQTNFQYYVSPRNSK